MSVPAWGNLHLPAQHQAVVNAEAQAQLDAELAVAAELLVQDDVPVSDGLRLNEADFQRVAKELGVEVPAIKAVVEIEAGKAHKGFHAPGEPIINFDLSMFRRYASKRGVNLQKYARSHAAVFTRGKNTGQSGAWTRFRAAESINPKAAIEGTFWGMFQIGGFNYKLMGLESPEQVRDLMTRSEHDQLELFAKFLINTGMVKYLRAKDWAGFAKRYNGPSYAKHAYHTRMASAYKRYKAQEK